MADLDFQTFTAPVPIVERVVAEYESLNSAFDAARTADERVAAIARWDELRRRIETWESLVGLRFNQDTRNMAYREAREYADEIRPQLVEPAVAFKRKLVESPHRPELEARLGAQAFALWEADILTFDPAIADDLVREAKLAAEYVELQAAAQVTFRGQAYNLSEIVKFREHADRATRHEAEQVRWQWFAENGAAQDRIFAEQVRVRHAMAKKLGFENFIGLAYKRMCRVDYGQADVERFRDAVRRHVVPLCLELKKRQQQTLGVETFMYWDEAVHDVAGNPAPQGEHDWMVARAQEMFQELSADLGDFFRLMVDAKLMDLKNREGKAGGGFCTSFSTYGVPYIYANFNGTKGDVEVFTHEMGHAFQGYMSRQQPLFDYLWPTTEACEIHSMGLEFLTLPQMEKFFGDDALRFARIHLLQSLLFLPYGVAVDHFQHLVYARPEASPAERHAMWQEMEHTYLPWRKYGDLPHLPSGGFWHYQRHVFIHPFYYIDYALAQCCALQFWAKGKKDFDATMRAYVDLCRRGGEAPFQDLVRSAGLISPFADGCLSDVVAQARHELGV